MSFTYSRRIHFYETDLMGIVHHANYLRLFEEARVAWLNSLNIDSGQIWGGGTLAVLETSIKHKGAAKFNEIVTIAMQIKQEGARVHFRYKMLDGNEKVLALGETVHAFLNTELKVCKPPKKLLTLLEKEIWTETWP